MLTSNLLHDSIPDGRNPRVRTQVLHPILPLDDNRRATEIDEYFDCGNRVANFLRTIGDIELIERENGIMELVRGGQVTVRFTGDEEELPRPRPNTRMRQDRPPVLSSAAHEEYVNAIGFHMALSAASAPDTIPDWHIPAPNFSPPPRDATALAILDNLQAQTSMVEIAAPRRGGRIGVGSRTDESTAKEIPPKIFEREITTTKQPLNLLEVSNWGRDKPKESLRVYYLARVGVVKNEYTPLHILPVISPLSSRDPRHELERMQKKRLQDLKLKLLAKDFASFVSIAHPEVSRTGNRRDLLRNGMYTKWYAFQGRIRKAVEKEKEMMEWAELVRKALHLEHMDDKEILQEAEATAMKNDGTAESSRV